MPRLFQRVFKLLRVAVGLAIGVSALLVVVAIWFWQDRPDISELDWPLAESTIEPSDAVTVTWLGVTTMLFDDGKTQILIDGFFTRRGPVDYLFRDIFTDVATVNYAMSEFRISRLSAIIPVHSHFDHAMDVGVVANRSSAVVLGSESTANIVLGARLPIDQYQILADGESRQFGDFLITLISSRHAPVKDGEDHWFPGKITEPLRQPAPISAWKAGETYSIVLSHPRGTTLIQGSGGFVKNKLLNVSADVVMLGVGGLAALGRSYFGQYWYQTVSLTGARRVFPVHYDDFSRPFGDIELFPRKADDVTLTAAWINGIKSLPDNSVDVQRLPFGSRVVLY